MMDLDVVNLLENNFYKELKTPVRNLLRGYVWVFLQPNIIFTGVMDNGQALATKEAITNLPGLLVMYLLHLE